ncbi:hypothetical protein Ancab_014738 [Ancistrocladus abbreviatus]
MEAQEGNSSDIRRLETEVGSANASNTSNFIEDFNDVPSNQGDFDHSAIDPSVRPSKKVRSKVWDHLFKICAKNLKDQRAKCKYCGAILGADPAKGTTCLKNHIDRLSSKQEFGFPSLEIEDCDGFSIMAAALLKRPRTLPSNSATMDYQTVDSEHVLKRARPFGISDENNDNRSLVDVKPRVDESLDKSKVWKLIEVNEASQCRSLRLPNTISAMRVSRLIYTNYGLAILALASNAVHKLWKWQRNDRNLTGKATASVVPQLWQPSSRIIMTNDLSDTNPEDAVSCFALSKNDSYVMSGCRPQEGKSPCLI